MSDHPSPPKRAREAAQREAHRLREMERAARAHSRPQVTVCLARSAPAAVRTALETARRAMAGRLDVVIEAVDALPDGAPFSLRQPWRSVDAPDAVQRRADTAIVAFAAAFEAAMATGRGR